MAKMRASLAELMGKNASDSSKSGSLKLNQLQDILGDAMPELPKTAVGRHRLVRSLQQRFGLNFRSLPGVKDLLKEFDADTAFEDKVRKMSAFKYKRSK